MYELAFGKHPFSGMKPIQVRRRCCLLLLLLLTAAACC
jgi:hypothetical protein